MGAWSALRELFDRREPLLAPMDDPFVHVDKSVAAERLKLLERGAAQGKLELPASDLTVFDNVETEILAYISEHYARAQIDAANSIRTYDGRLSGLALLSRLSSIAAASSKAVSDFKAAVANSLNRLSNSRDAITSSYEELRIFRAEHDLKRPAHPAPPSISTFGAIALTWLFETSLNAVLLRINDSLGYLGGIAAAAAVGFVNVATAATVGRQVWPRAYHQNAAVKALAWVGIAVWVLFVGVWNLLAAHYRDAKSLGLPLPEQRALEMMGEGLQGIYSWGLLIVGILFALGAAIAGFRMDDPYPGYGQVSRRHNRRCEDYAEEVAAATDDLTAIRDDAIAEATSVREELESQLAEQDQILAARAAFSRRYEEFGTQVELIANGLLQDYRAANRAVRTTAAPEHFNDRWVLPRTALPPAKAATVSSREVQAAENTLEKAVVDISQAFDAAIERFEPLDVLKRRLADG